jgi:hypothetical protein
MFFQGAPNVNTQKGSISVDAAGVNFNQTSDYRLKSNVVDLPAASEVVKTLQPRSYSIGGLDNVSGFIAHELQAVVPRAVTGTKDAVDEEGNPNYQSVDQTKLIPLLTKALQEALTEIDTLKARVTALES